ncbi:MAG TPA: MFS transporter [Gemmatimonadales bacterium]|nr:MFS transporter [Gemmatimonadales bacterium]
MKLRSATGRWILAGSVLGSGAVFLEGSVVNVALPAIARSFHLGVDGLQWVVNGYLLTLSALMLFGGSLGDRFPRPRVFAVGCVAFALFTIGCALAPSLLVLVALRLLQGMAGALLVPNSLAMLETSFEGEERGAAIGQWAGWSAVSTALGPLAGGWLVDAGSWRWVFASVAPFALVAAWLSLRHGPAGERRAGRKSGPLDYLGAILATLGLAGLVGALIVGPSLGFGAPLVLGAGIAGVLLLLGFVAHERRLGHGDTEPLLPLGVFRSRQFTGANLMTLLVYGALNGLMFLLMPQLQDNLGYDALTAGAALLPVNALMLTLSPVAGRIATRIGPRLPMVVGVLTAAGAMALFARVQPGTTYVGAVLPAAIVFGLGLACMVAPLTAAVLGAVDEGEVGVASAINNAAARLAGLLAAAGLPLVAGLGGMTQLEGPAFAAGYARAMWICAGLCVAGALVAVLTMGGPTARRPR